MAALDSPSAPARAPLRRDPLFWALAALGVVQAIRFGAALHGAEPNLAYPFMDGDSWDWLANGLFFAGDDVRFSGRPPLLPLAVASLDRLGGLSWLPVLLQALFQSTVLALYATARRLHGRGPALAAALCLALGFSFRGLSYDLMADVPAACLVTLASALALAADERPRLWLPTFGLAGLGALTQQAGLLWLPAALGAALFGRRRLLRQPAFLAGLGLFVALQIAWIAWKLARFGTAGDLLLRQWALVSWHVDAIGASLWSLAAILGLPAMLLAVAGASAGLRSLFDERREGALTLALLSMGLALFFGLFYDFGAKRFWVYVAIPSLLALSAALARVRRRWATAALATIAVLGAALPLPEPARDARWLALWPGPPLFAHAELATQPTGGVRPLLATARLRLASLAEIVSWHRATEGLVVADPSPPFDSRVVADVDSVLYLHAPAEVGERYRLITRLGNVLRKRVKFVPAEFFAPAIGRIAIRTMGAEVAGTALFRIDLPGRPRPWLLAAAANSDTARALAERAGESPTRPIHPAALRRAQAAIDRLAGSDVYVAVVPPAAGRDLTPLVTVLLLRTTEIYVFPAGERAAALARAAALPDLGRSQIGPAEIRRTRVFGRPAGWVIYP